MKGASCVVTMSAKRTSITSSKSKVHNFSYDHCFWSVEEGAEVGGGGGGARVGGGRKWAQKSGGGWGKVRFAGQDMVYNELARPLLDDSFRGYNTCLFSYGPTGSGKSYW